MTYCQCETPVMDVEHDAGCRRCGLPVDFTPRIRYAVGVTEAQRLSAEALHEFDETQERGPVSATVARYGSTGCVLLVLSSDLNPAPNPVRHIWSEGNAHVVTDQESYETWLEVLADRVEAIERADDCVFVIAPGGEHVTFARVGELLARL